MRKPSNCIALFIALICLSVFYFLFVTTAHITQPIRVENAMVFQPKQRNSILFLAASHSMNQYMQLWNTLETLRDICNAGWDVAIQLQISNGLQSNASLLNQLKHSLSCSQYDEQSGSYVKLSIPLHLTEYNPDIGFGLNSRHRSIAQNLIKNYDYFIYAEEDMRISLTNFLGYLQGMKTLKEHYPSHWMDYTIGFLRYEEDHSLSTKVTWEYAPTDTYLVPLSTTTPQTLTLITANLNQAIYIFPREQLLYLQQRCDYLSKPGVTPFYRELRKAMNMNWKGIAVGTSEWSSSFQHILQCGIKRVIPLELFDELLIYHSTNIARHRRDKNQVLTIEEWYSLLAKLQEQYIHQDINPSVESIYADIIAKQYNIQYLDHEKLRKEHVKYVPLLPIPT